MIVDTVSHHSDSCTTAAQTNFLQIRADFQTFRTTDLASAPKEVTLLGQGASKPLPTVRAGNSPLANLQLLANSLQSNDAAGAQAAIANLQEALVAQSSGQNERSDFHAPGNDDSSVTTSSPSSPASPTTFSALIDLRA